MELLNLKKGMSLDLTKRDDSLKHLHVGLGWQTKMDLDAFAFLLDDEGKEVDKCCYYNLVCRGVKLLGDDTVGAGTGDNEVILIDFDKLPKNVTKIAVYTNIYKQNGIFSNQKFDKVKNAFVRLVNDDNKKEICRYNLTEDGSAYNAFHFVDIVQDSEGNWKVVAVGLGTNGSIGKIEHQYM